MASSSEQSRVRELFDSMTLGVVRSLGKSSFKYLIYIYFNRKRVINFYANLWFKFNETQGKIWSKLTCQYAALLLLFLEKKPGVTDVRLLDRQPAEKHIIFTWEQVIIHFLNKH